MSVGSDERDYAQIQVIRSLCSSFRSKNTFRVSRHIIWIISGNRMYIHHDENLGEYTASGMKLMAYEMISLEYTPAVPRGTSEFAGGDHNDPYNQTQFASQPPSMPARLWYGGTNLTLVKAAMPRLVRAAATLASSISNGRFGFSTEQRCSVVSRGAMVPSPSARIIPGYR
ncbi:hypothetical protein BD779DRAFT_1551540 [Infundibulicybe gibba]|nr:hypothetical protein BD779DRAFT_1551540 [Infundibulicybe gibba]